MSGHSKWSSIKHKKAAIDSKRGQLFTKLGRDVMMAARGGGDPEMNAGLRLAIQKAKDANMPNANIDRAVQRGSGSSDADNLEEITYEGYGPGGTAILVDAVTENRNRTAAEIRLAFSRGGGNLAESGAVGWQFELRGVIAVDATGQDADEIQLAAIEAGADDVDESGDGSTIEVITDPGATEQVRQALTEAGFTVDPAAVRWLVERAGGGVGRLRGDVERVRLYAAGRRQVTLADVQAVGGAAVVGDDWAVTLAITRGQAGEALAALGLSLESGAAPIAVLGQLAWFVRSRLPPEQVEAVIGSVFETDLALKSSTGDPRVLLERLVVDLCVGAEARARRG